MSVFVDRYLKQLGEGADVVYRGVALEFDRYLNGRKPTSELAQGFIRSRRRLGYAPGTLRRDWGILTRIFKLSGVVLEGESPKVAPRDIVRPAVNDLMPDLIRAAKTLSPKHQALMALSSVYGMRRVEMCWYWDKKDGWVGMGPGSVDLRGNTIYVETAKHGRERYHTIAPEIRPVLEAYDWGVRKPREVSEAWNEICRAAGAAGEQFHGVGWHAVRRSVDIALVEAGFSDLQASQYMRWRLQASMAQRYASAVQISRDGSARVAGVMDAELDRQAFAALPWLPVWSET